jgi:site-specific recombinase XerD
MITEITLSPTAQLTPARHLHADAEGGQAHARILHRADQQRPHAQGVSERDPALRRLVRRAPYPALTDVHAFHVAAFIKDLQREFSAPTVKQHLAALRMLFDWLVTGHILDVNPAHAVRGPKYVVKKGKTPVLTAGIKTRIGNHTFRATGITAYLKNDGKLEHAQTIANHSSPRTTKLYDRRQDEITLDEVERIVI